MSRVSRKDAAPTMEHLLPLNQAFYALSVAPTQPMTLVVGSTSHTKITRRTLTAEDLLDPDTPGRLCWRLTVPSKKEGGEDLLDLEWTSTELRACSVFGRRLERLRDVAWDDVTYTLRIKL